MHAALLALLCPQRPKPAPGTQKDATGHSAGPAALGQYLAMGLVDVVCGCGLAEGHAGSRREKASNGKQTKRSAFVFSRSRASLGAPRSLPNTCAWPGMRDPLDGNRLSWQCRASGGEV